MMFVLLIVLKLDGIWTEQNLTQSESSKPNPLLFLNDSFY